MEHTRKLPGAALRLALGAIATLIVVPILTVGLIIDVRHQKRSGGELPSGPAAAGNPEG